MKKKMSAGGAKKGDMKTMSPKDKFKAMMEAKKKASGKKTKLSYGGKKKGQKMSITTKKAKVVKQK